MRSALAVLLIATATPVAAQRDDQTEAYEAARSGRIRSLGDILSRLRPEQRRDFIGSEFSNGNYRLKFMERGEVRNVDVDARTGEFRGRDDDRRDFVERRMNEYNDDRRRFEDDDRSRREINAERRRQRFEERRGGDNDDRRGRRRGNARSDR